ncbi:hypothetical protein D9M71_692080 [compost metagenome]
MTTVESKIGHPDQVPAGSSKCGPFVQRIEKLINQRRQCNHDHRYRTECPVRTAIRPVQTGKGALQTNIGDALQDVGNHSGEHDHAHQDPAHQRVVILAEGEPAQHQDTQCSRSPGGQSNVRGIAGRVRHRQPCREVTGARQRIDIASRGKASRQERRRQTQHCHR